MTPRFPIFCLAVALPLVWSAGPAAAQTPPAVPKKHGKSIPGTPLDTLMSTHFKTDVPPAQDFVRDSRPDPAALDYAPLTGVDPERPKLRDKPNIEALQAELEHSGEVNARRARGLHPAPAKRVKRAKDAPVRP